MIMSFLDIATIVIIMLACSEFLGSAFDSMAKRIKKSRTN